jgi:hypothetical protein
MAKQSRVILCTFAILLASGLVLAQDREPVEERVFNLVVGERLVADVEQDVEVVPVWQPGIERGRWDLTLTLGNMMMEKTLLQYDRIIYKATNEHFYYGNVELSSQSAFNPILRLGYNLTTWLALEAQFGVTFSEYDGSIENPFRVNPFGGEPEAVNLLGQFDPEHRSSLVFNSNINAVWYPLNMDGDGRGRVHPYVTGGVGVATYSLDSQYVDDPASGFNVNGGIGLRIIADRLISVRTEILYQYHAITFEPAELFDDRDQGTVRIPVYRFDTFGNYERVGSYAKQTLGGLTWQIGFAVSF